MPTRPRDGGPTPTPHNDRFRTQPAGTAGRASAAPIARRRRVAGDPAGPRRPRKTTRCFGEQDFMAGMSLTATALTIKAQATGPTLRLIDVASDGTSRSDRSSSLGRVAWSASLEPVSCGRAVDGKERVADGARPRR